VPRAPLDRAYLSALTEVSEGADDPAFRLQLTPRALHVELAVPWLTTGKYLVVDVVDSVEANEIYDESTRLLSPPAHAAVARIRRSSASAAVRDVSI
jgi:hypothetical protein